MSESANKIVAQKREDSGKGSARALRRDGRIPGVIYGEGKKAASISLGSKEIRQEYFKGNFKSKLYDVDLDGKNIRVIPKDVQLHPVTDVPLHVDFLEVKKGKKIRVFVPVKFINTDKSPGIKRGGVLNVVRRRVELLCEPDSIPEKLVSDLASMRIGESVHISAIELPEGVQPTIQDRDFTIATIVGRGKTAEAEEAEETEEAEEAAEE